MAGKIVEYRRYDPIPGAVKPIVVVVDETGNVYDLDGKPWVPLKGVRLKLKWKHRLRAMTSTEPS